MSPTSSTPSVHDLGILLSAAGRFLECMKCNLSFEFPFGAPYATVAKQFESRQCSFPKAIERRAKAATANE
jgi:hypothetical protein